MQSAQVGMWDPHPPPKQHAPPLGLSHVSAPAAKRITFYKSGDSQFGGVKMAVHKRSFKCFDALLDDLSQKVPLPFGVRTVTTPRGTHTISHLEQLQDGGCYLCSDRRHAKPINMEIATKQPRTWSHHGRRPHRPESTSATPPGHMPYRQRRLLLVKNTEPGMRRSVVLSRRVTRSLRAFLEEASDVMQFHVRKLYTVEGRKIDHVQSLMTCPNVLVCVGREAFSPLLVNYVRKSSEEKLPGLGTRTPGNGARSPAHGAQSRASENSEGPDNKKNMVNFGLETKKSIIHPRSDSSTRSARFSMSSEKSNGLSTVSQGHAAILNDDIEKRVVVNKDGSLSVEMKVRFRLQSDETLKWSTRIKKSPSLTNDCASQGQPHYLPQECCSDPDCNSFEQTQSAMDANRCSRCYGQDQQYDLWENPAHCHKQPVPPPHSMTENHTIYRHTHSSSSSSSCNSTRVVRCRARLTNCEDGSEHSQIVQEEMCITEQHIAEQDIHTVNQSFSRSEVVVNGDDHSSKSGEEDVERPMSAISASSHVLQALKEDDDVELPTTGTHNVDKPTGIDSATQNSHSEMEAASTCNCQSTSGVEGDERSSTSKSKAGSFKSANEAATDEVEEVRRVGSGLSIFSRQSATSLCLNCGGWKVKVTSACSNRASKSPNGKSPKPATPNSIQDEDDCASKTEECTAEEDRASSVASSQKSRSSHKSGCRDDKTPENRSSSVISAKSGHSSGSAGPDLTTSEEVAKDNTSERSVSAMSAKSCTSIKVTPPSTAEDEEEDDLANVQSEKFNSASQEDQHVSAEETQATPTECAELETRVASVLSVKSNRSRSASPVSVKSNKSENEEVKSNGRHSRTGSVLSVKSDVSKNSEKEKKEMRASSAISVKSNASGKSAKSHLSEKSAQDEMKTFGVDNQNDAVKSNASVKQSRRSSAMSNKSARSERSSKAQVQSASEVIRGTSAMSVKSTPEKDSRPASVVSGTSSTSHVSVKSKEKVVEDTRTASAISSKTSHKTEHMSKSLRSNADGEEREGSTVSEKSRKSCELNCNAVVQDGAERSASAVSCKSSLSVKSSRSASPGKQKEERALSRSSGKSHSSVASARSKKSAEPEISTNMNESNDNASQRMPSPVSVKSGTSRKFHVTAVKTPEVANVNRPEKSSLSNSLIENSINNEEEEASESLIDDQVSKIKNFNDTQELIPVNGNQRGSSSLSVRSGKSGKSSRSKCSCGRKKETDRAAEDFKGDDFEDDSFASVSLVLPEDHESESGESSFSSRRIKSQTATPEVSKTADNVDDEQVGPNNLKANDIPMIQTPVEHDKDDTDEKTREASICSTKSTDSNKSAKFKTSCNSCGKLKTNEVNGIASPASSVKSIATTRTGQLTAPDNRTASAMSSASNTSQRKSAKAEEVDKSSESSEHASKEDGAKAVRAKSKSPSRLRPKSSASNKSQTNSNKGKDDCVSVQSVKSSQSKEGNAKSPSLKNVCRLPSKGDSCSESTLSHSLSAADLLKEANAKLPDSPRSKCSKSSIKSTKSHSSKKEAALELTPSSLPNASPNEVVSDWLKSIPTNVQAIGEEEGLVEKIDHAMDGETGGGDEEGKEEEEEEKAEECQSGEEVAKEDGKVETFEIQPNGVASMTSVPKNWEPSAAVMKVLLSSSLGRCRSMPEVSPVYGRRLSASAKELLDCLAQLQLIEPAGHQGYSVQKDQRPQFEDIIGILQSLWLNEPRDICGDPKGKDQVSPPRSSSGVGMSSGSGGSGKDNGIHEDDPKTDAAVAAEAEGAPESPDSPKASDNPSSLDKNSKSPTDNELDTHEGSSSDKPPKVSRSPLIKRPSQDPNPAWVLNLLKKLEKQFINHYVNAMADFKVKWDLEDNLILDRMIVELKDEVSQRIEKSVEKEMKKIQGRAGKVRVPRPPQGSFMSQDSVVTEKRRQRLMGMKKLSAKTGDSASDGELTVETSDQRSDDEYCPCDTCVRKKMAARPLKTNPNAIEAPVHTEFDLFRILQLKKTPTPAAPKTDTVQPEAKRLVEEDCRNLEVVQEETEDEESKVGPETAEVSEEDKCQCSEADSDDQTEDSDKETVREKSSQKEAEEEKEGADEDSNEGEASEEASTEERASEQDVPAVCVTEGDDADVEDSGTEEKSEDEETKAKTQTATSRPKQDVPLLHQCTKTSVESQSGSLEDSDDRLVANAKGPRKLASPGGTSHKRSRSPARVKRRKAINSDSDLDNI